MGNHNPLNIKMVSSAIGRGAGVARYISNLTYALRELGHDVALVQPSNVALRRSLTVMMYNFRNIGYARTQSNSIIHCHEGDGGLMLRSKNIHITTIHGVLADEARYFRRFKDKTAGHLIAQLEALNCRRADLCTAVSEFSRRRAIESYGIDPSHIRVVPPCIDLDTFKPMSTVDSELKTVLFVGQIYRRKGLDVLIQALNILRRENVFVRIIGTGAEQNRIADLVRKLDLSHFVSFLGCVSEAELLHSYQTSSVVCIPSFQEGFGMVAIEAQACGVPVVGTRAGGLPEAVVDAKLLVPPGDANELSQALMRAISDRSRSNRSQCREFVERRFSPYAVATMMENIYREALGS